MNELRTSKTSLVALVLAIAAAGLLGCNGNKKPAEDPDGKVITTGSGQTLTEKAANKFNDGLKALNEHDKANDWTDANCASTATMFLDAAKEQGDKTFFEAHYNAGISYQRCKNDAAALKQFDLILGKDAKFHRARVQVALYKFQASGGKDIDGAIAQMNKAIEDAEYKNEEALVNLAMFQMLRDNDISDEEGKNDFERAKVNLQRALAINDSFMPAFNQLAVYYLEKAKKKAGRKKGRRGQVAAASEKAKRVDSQALELAALVCSQAIRKNPNYAPVFNTTGLIAAELGDLSQAARSFGNARRLDPKFFEAHMNYAAVNLQFRGFKRAEEAYRKAIALKGKDFEAHLGLALALRGQINDSNFDKMLAESSKELAEARKIAPDRAETYYNEAILTQEFKAREGGDKAEPILKSARSLFDQFVKKAGDGDAYKVAVKRATERIEEIDQIITFNKQTREEQKRMEEMRKRQEAEAAMNKASAKKK